METTLQPTPTEPALEPLPEVIPTTDTLPSTETIPIEPLGGPIVPLETAAVAQPVPLTTEEAITAQAINITAQQIGTTLDAMHMKIEVADALGQDTSVALAELAPTAMQAAMQVDASIDETRKQALLDGAAPTTAVEQVWQKSVDIVVDHLVEQYTKLIMAQINSITASLQAKAGVDPEVFVKLQAITAQLLLNTQAR